MPQNSGGKYVLTENIVKIGKIYDAIGTGRIMAKKLYNQSGTVRPSPKFVSLSSRIQGHKCTNEIYEHVKRAMAQKILQLYDGNQICGNPKKSS